MLVDGDDIMVDHLGNRWEDVVRNNSKKNDDGDNNDDDDDGSDDDNNEPGGEQGVDLPCNPASTANVVDLT